MSNEEKWRQEFESFWASIEREYGHQRSPSCRNAKKAYIAARKAAQDEIDKLETRIRTLGHDYWFMSNLLERCSSSKEEAVYDCIERMKFRKPFFEGLEK